MEYRIVRKTLVHLCILAQVALGQETLVVFDIQGESFLEHERVALTNRLSYELDQRGSFIPVERTLVEESLKSSTDSSAPCLSTPCLLEVGKELEAQEILIVKIGQVGDVYSCTLKMINTKSGKTSLSALIDYQGEKGELLTRVMGRLAQYCTEKYSPPAIVSPANAENTSKASSASHDDGTKEVKKKGLFERLFSRKGYMEDYAEVKNNPKYDTLAYQSEKKIEKAPQSVKSRSSDQEEVYQIEWVLIPAGPYRYGKHAKTMTNLNYDFEIMKYEVTNYQYMKFLTEAMETKRLSKLNKNTVEGFFEGDKYWNRGNRELYDLDDGDNHIHWDGKKFYIDKGYENHPVVEVTWFGANAFAEFYGYKLPSDFAWEKAARGNTDLLYPWGDNPPSCEDANFYNCNKSTIPVGQTTGVSPYGVFDMAGNVWEWSRDYFNPKSYVKVIRGGAWDGFTGNMHTSFRENETPTNSTRALGFRCIRIPTQK